MNDIAVLWDQAQQAYHAHDFQQAQAGYECILQLDPHHLEALTALGLLMAQQNQLDQALVWFEQAIRLAPYHSALHYYLGNTLAGLQVWDKALHHFQIVLNVQPNHAHAHNNVGRLLHKQNQFDKACRHYQQALQINPHYLEAAINLGLLWVAKNNIEAAQIQFQSILKWKPDTLIVYEQLAQLALQRDCFKEALQYYDDYLKLNRDSVEVWNNRGAIFNRMGNIEEASAAFLHVLSLDTQHASARYNLATLYLQKNQLKEAIWEYTLYLRLAPTDPEGYYNLGVAFMLSGQLPEALHAFQEVISLNEHSSEAWCNIGAIHMRQHNAQQAYDAYQKVIRLNPEHATARFMSSALLQSDKVNVINKEQQTGSIPQSAPIEYVKTLFNNYASYFDEHLTHGLHYQVPQQLYELMSPYLKEKKLITVDLGCGTGLSGMAFKPVIQHLTGVDIAANMLAEAKKKEIYHELVEVDMLQYCHQSTFSYELILCVDTLVYFGELTTFFESISRVAKPNAYLAASVEVYPPHHADPAGYRLQPTGRYQHQSQSITYLAKQTGWQLIQNTQVKGRMNQDEAVDIGLFLFQKTAEII